MEINKLLETLHTINRLKDTTRHCYTPGGRHESVAEHSWRTTIMAYLMYDEFPDIDINKVIKMCLIHDLGEVFTGDIPTFYKTGKDEDKEANLLTDWVNSLPEPFSTEFSSLYEEMALLESKEAKLYKALDNLEAVISHNESDISTWIELEYSLNRTYGNDKVAFSEYLKKFRALACAETDEKLRAAGIEPPK